MRQRGIGKRLVLEVIKRKHNREVSFLETTVGTTNKASRALFKSLGRDLNAEIVEEMYFDSTLFPQGNHEPEYLWRIGPVALN